MQAFKYRQIICLRSGIFFHYELVLYMFEVAAVQQFDPKKKAKNKNYDCLMIKYGIMNDIIIV